MRYGTIALLGGVGYYAGYYSSYYAGYYSSYYAKLEVPCKPMYFKLALWSTLGMPPRAFPRG